MTESLVSPQYGIAISGVPGTGSGAGFLLALAVLAGLGYGTVRLVRRYRARRSHPETEPAALALAIPGQAAVTKTTPPPATPSAGWAVETRSLTKRFDHRTAVDNVNLLVPRGSAFGYLGPNGAGKTTLIRVLLGLTKADSGSMALLGIPVPGERRQALARVGAIVDEPRFHGHLTGRENLRVLAAARGGGAERQIAPALDRTGLAERADDKVAAYSMGMRQRLGVAACLLADPQLLILDEPMNGLDPAGMHEMRDMIRALTAEGRTVMLSSHLLDEVERTCDTVAIVDHGQVIHQGPIRDLTAMGGARLEVECSDLTLAASALGQTRFEPGVTVNEKALTVALLDGTPEEQAAEINRRLVTAGIDVYGLHRRSASLEDWFLSVTSRLGDAS